MKILFFFAHSSSGGVQMFSPDDSRKIPFTFLLQTVFFFPSNNNNKTVETSGQWRQYDKETALERTVEQEANIQSMQVLPPEASTVRPR